LARILLSISLAVMLFTASGRLQSVVSAVSAVHAFGQSGWSPVK